MNVFEAKQIFEAKAMLLGNNLSEVVVVIATDRKINSSC